MGYLGKLGKGSLKGVLRFPRRNHISYAILRLSKDCKKELIGLDKSIKEILETLLGL